MAGEFYISGIGSNQFDYMSYLEKYRQLKTIPIQQMTSQAKELKLKADAISAISAKLSALTSPALDLTLSSTYENKKASVDNTDIATATASTEALTGTYNLTVNQLAKASSYTVGNTSGISDLDTPITATGTLTINYKQDGTATSFSIDYNGKTLKEVAQAINDATGLQATIVNVGGSSNPNYKLVISSENTGLANEITSITDSGTYFNDVNQNQAAQDAQIVLNGITITNSTNEFNNVITGLSLTVKDVGSTTINIAEDNSAVKDALENIINGYNQLKETIGLATSKGQPLQGEASLNSIARGVLNIITSYLGKYGLIDTKGDAETTRGLLELKTDALDNFLKRDDAKDILQNMASAIEKYVGTYSDSLTITNQRYTEQLSDIKTRIEDLQKRIDAQIEAMRLRFARLEIYLSDMQALQQRIQSFAGLLSNNNTGNE